MAFVRMGGGGASKIKITYDVEGTEYTEEYKKGDDILHPTTFEPLKTNYTFYGWALSSGGARVEEAVADKELTLYALFLINTTNFAYTGGVQTFKAKKGVTYLLKVYGAQGGGVPYSANGGKGGYSYGNKKFDKDTDLFVVIGGMGADGILSTGVRAGGYNGGGSGYSKDGNSYTINGAGGGASHIGLTSGLLKNTTKANLLIVGGGGGGGCKNGEEYYNGGTGGGTNGGNGSNGGSYLGGMGGTQTAGGSAGSAVSGMSAGGYGYGSSYTNIYGYYSGGGGGYYGGSVSYVYAGGGGGSGYVGGVSNGAMTNGLKTGHGSASITIVSVE